MTAEPLTLKAVVDANIASLEGRGRKLGALNGHTSCYYRYPDGCGCAIGVALPDDHPLIVNRDTATCVGGVSLNEAVLNNPSIIEHLSFPSESDYALMLDLQSSHDWLCQLAGPDKVDELCEYISILSQAYVRVYPDSPLPEVLTVSHTSKIAKELKWT